jgi:thioredoxin reductase (NADPH)
MDMGAWDIVIVGGGPAGLAAAQYGARANMRTLVLEELACGGQSLLIDRLENYPGLPEPVSGYDFGESMKAQAEKFGAGIKSGTVSAVVKEGASFKLETDGGTVRAGAVILATGAKHRHLGVKGESEFAGKGVSYCATCDGPFFKGMPILVVGGGDAACDEGSFLAKLSDRVTMVHRRDRFRAQSAVAARILDNPSVTVRWNSLLKEIKGDSKVRSVVLEDVRTHEETPLAVEAVFVFIGSDPRSQLAGDADKDAEGYLVTDQCMQTSVPGLFAAGDVRASPFRQVVVAAGEGAIAAHCAARYIESSKGGA